MTFYLVSELVAFLYAEGCELTGDSVLHGTAWMTKDGHGFLLPDSDGPFISAALVDRILSDRWMVSCAPTLRRFIRTDDGKFVYEPPSQ